MTRAVVVIGGGVGGLAAAIRLAAAGHRVKLFEKNNTLGGKLNLWQIAHPNRAEDRPFRFDTGPSLLTLPFVFQELFAAAGETMADHLELIRLDPISRFQWGDGSYFELGATAEQTEQEILRFAPDQLPGWKALSRRGRQIWDLSAEMFLYHAPEQSLRGDKFDLRRALSMLSIPLRIGMFRKYSREIDWYISHPRLRELLYQYATYSGASPFKAPATLCVIPHAEQQFGGWYIRGGLYRLTEALEMLAKKLGVDIRVNAPVAKLIVHDKRAAGVLLHNGESIEADSVIVNSDVVYSYRMLIDPSHRKKYRDATLDRLEPGGSGMVLMLGVEGKYPQLAHHTKFMPANYTSDLQAMFETHSVPDDPCIYVAASTRTDPTQAPEGCENLFILASAPAIDGKLDWNVEGPRYRDQIVQKLESAWGLTGLAKRIVVERCLTPQSLQKDYNANAGSIYGIGSNTLRNAFLRPPNRDRDIRNLYFAGGATHPGGGLPLVALSGKIAAELLLADAG